MREYIRKSCGTPKAVYARVKATLSDYDRLKRERMDVLYGSGAPQSGMPKGTEIGNPTERKAIRLAAINSDLEAIDQVCVLLRGAYGSRVHEDFDPIKAYWSYDYFNYVHVRTAKMPEGPARRTWHRYKDDMTLMLAQKLKYF